MKRQMNNKAARSRLRMAAALLALVGGGLETTGQQTHVVVDSGYSSFAEGELEGMALRAEGKLETGPRLEKLADLDAATVWAALPDGRGGVWISAGEEARLWHVESDGTVSERFGAGAVFGAGLAQDAEGRLYFGTSPNGSIYQLDTEGRSGKLLARLPVQYIWSLALEDRFLWAATGQPARLYRIDPADGEPEVMLEAPVDHFQRHVVADGNHYLGGSPGGTVYRVGADGEAEALVSLPEPEIGGLAVDGKGVLWILGLDPESSSGGGGEMNPEEAFRRAMGKGMNGGSGQNGSGSSRLYRRSGDGFVLPVWEAPAGAGASLALFGSSVKVVGTASGGKLYGITGRDRWGELARLPGGGEIGHVMTDADASGGLLVVSSQPGAVYRLGGRAEGPGVFTSRILDAGQPVQWGTVELLVEGRPGMKVEVRGGNSPEVDLTWTDWRPVSGEQEASFRRGSVDLPPVRYARYRVTMSEETAADALRRVRLFVQLPNAAPLFGEVVSVPFAVESRTVPGNGRGFGVKALFREGGAKQIARGQEDRVQFQRSTDRAGRSFFWQARDPNGDPLVFDLLLHHRGDGQRHLLEKDWEETHFVLVTEGLVEGVYQLEVVARDQRDRGESSSREFSEPFLVDQRPPAITVVERSWSEAGLEVAFTVRDEWSVVETVEAGPEGAPLRPVLPEDGLFDRREESFRVRWPEADAEAGIRIRAVDESGREALRVAGPGGEQAR